MNPQSPSNPDRQTVTATPKTPSDPADLTLDTVYGLLSNQRRRHVLRYLFEKSATTTLGQLAEYIAAIENDKPEAALSSSERKRVYIGLFQSHLPKMDEADVIDYDDDRKTVVIGENAEEVARFLPEENDERPSEGTLTSLVGKLPNIRR